MRKNTSTNRTARWRDANRDHHNSYMRDYRQTPSYAMMADSDEMWFERDPRKRKLLIQATPSWSDRDEIRRIYEKCDALNQRYPQTGFVVHHIIPITHPKVCGLHVPGNLKIVSLSMKRKLGRKFDYRQSD